MSQSLVFVSYSHKDEREKEVLLSHLGVLQNTGLIDTWSDSRIKAGGDWELEIERAMGKAKVAVLLITANFLNSDFISGREVPTLLKRRESEGLTVFPVIARHCAWKEINWLAKMNVRPKNGKPVWDVDGGGADEKLTAIAEEVAEIIKADAATTIKTAAPDSSSALRMNVDQWAYVAERTPKFPDRLLQGQHFSKEDELFRTLADFLKTALDRGLSVEVYSPRSQTIEHIPTVKQLWVILLSLLVLNSEGEGAIRWLIRETVRLLREDKLVSGSMAANVWEHISQRYCNHLSPYHRPELIEVILTSTIESAGKSHEFLYRFVAFLYRNLESDPLAIRRIAEHLQQFDEKLGNDAAPGFLERLKYLIGMGIAIATHGIADIPQFNPRLVTITRSKNFDYEFQAMAYPITVYDYSSLRGVLPKNIGENPLYPFVFQIVSEEGHKLFNLLESEVLSIVNLCRQRERDDKFDWDVPTVNEWLALADCEGQPYPWGIDTPTPSHANLDFGSPSKLRPVGTYPLGASKFGTHDCCGNVHEIVRISMGNMFPSGSRLAGGCYQTNAKFSSCQQFRAFRKRKEDYRRNTGVRLIRFLKRDGHKRHDALQRFLRQEGTEL